LKTIFVGNLSSNVTADSLHALFEAHGEILGIDLAPGQEFGYVRMADDTEAYRAITALNGKPCSGRMLNITVAQAYGSRKRYTSGESRTTAASAPRLVPVTT